MVRPTAPAPDFALDGIVNGQARRVLALGRSAAVLLGVGVLKGVLTGRPLVRSGLEFASVALGSVGWLVGTLFESAFGIVAP